MARSVDTPNRIQLGQAHGTARGWPFSEQPPCCVQPGTSCAESCGDRASGWDRKARVDITNACVQMRPLELHNTPETGGNASRLHRWQPVKHSTILWLAPRALCSTARHPAGEQGWGRAGLGQGRPRRGAGGGGQGWNAPPAFTSCSTLAPRPEHPKLCSRRRRASRTS